MRRVASVVLAGKKIVTDLLSEILRVDHCGSWLERMEEVEGKYLSLIHI